MCWLLADVLPLLPADVSIEVGGAGGDWIPADDRVRYVGPVPSAPNFLGAAVVAIPTQSGGGIEIKTLDALGSGVPVVGSPTAFRGVAGPPAHASVAETPVAFADALVASLSAPRESDAAVAGRVPGRRPSTRRSRPSSTWSPTSADAPAAGAQRTG